MQYVSFKYADERTLNEVTARDLIVRYNLFRDGGPTNKLFDLQEIKKKCLRFHTDLSYHEDHIFEYSYYFLIENIILSNFCGYYYMYYGKDSNNSLSRIGKLQVQKLLDAYDTYYISRKRNLELPVWKVSIQDVDNSCYYINPRNGQYRYVNTPSRWNHWMYPALHSLNLKFLVDHPVLWNIVMWGTMLGGTFVSLSGVWLAIKYIRRKARRKK